VNWMTQMKIVLRMVVFLTCMFLACIPVSGYEFTLNVYGNANMDDIIDENDISFLHGILDGTKEKTLFADANNDGIINEDDLTRIKAIITGDEDSLTIIDHEGVTVTVDIPVQTIAPLMLSPLQIVTHLGAEDKVVAVGNNIKLMGENKSFVLHEHPELKNLPDIGTTTDPSTEAIIQANPDVILGTIHTGKEISQIVSQNTKSSFLYINPNESFEGEGGAYEIWRKLALILGNDERYRAEELIQICNDKISDIEKKTSTITESDKPKVLLVSAIGDSLVTSSTYEPITIAGGINVADGIHTNNIHGMDVIAIEQIIAWNPDVILVHSGSSLTIEKIVSDPNFKSLNAVKNNRVYYTKAWFTGWDPATGLCECLYFAKLFNPDKFSDLNVENNCNEILEEFYGDSGLYDWMLKNGYNLYTWK